MKNIVLLLSAVLCFSSIGAAALEVYKYAPEVKTSERYEVRVSGKKVVVLPTNEPHVALFGADKAQTVEVKFLAGAPSKVEIRPLGKNYEYVLKGDILKIKLKSYDRISVEADGDTGHPLFIFVNPEEKKALAAAKKDPSTLVFEAGKIYKKNLWQVFDKYKNVYIQGGAILQGFLRQDKEIVDCGIDGCGIINARETEKNVAFHIKKSQNFSARNITVLNRIYWTFRMDFSDSFTVDNVKAVADCPFNDNWDENDAIHFVACTNGKVSRCFGYSWDDAYNITSGFFKNVGPCYNISLEDCIGWNVQPGNSFEISWSVKEDIHDISYKNIYSIHSGTKAAKNRRAAVSIHNGGHRSVSNISYENVWIEDPQESAISIFALKEGAVHDISYKNIFILKPAERGIAIQGKSEDNKVRNISFENLWYKGRKIESIDDEVFHQKPYPMKFTENISVK